MRTTKPNVTISPITLHLDADEESYEEYPKVGVVAPCDRDWETGW